MTREYCTYFDHRYAARGVAMIRSLLRHAPATRVWVLCMDMESHELFRKLNEPGLNFIHYSDFEAGDEALQAAKRDGRTLMEYYFTCTASLIRFVMHKAPHAEFVTYLDADLWFFADPEPIYMEMANAAVLIIPHRYPRGQEARQRYGIFNVGWVSFRRTPVGLACLEWWRNQCLEWCFDIVDETNDRFADQRYLNRFATLFRDVCSLQHPGANLAPWNVAGHHLELRDKIVMVDRQPLLFFHFHGLKRAGRRLFLTSHGHYGAPVSSIARKHVYRPYLSELLRVEHELAPHLPHVSDVSIRLGAPRLGTNLARLRKLRGHARSAYAMLRGLTVWVSRSS
jgi:hypothetical protein